MRRSRRSISKEDVSSLLADSGISLSSPPAIPAALLEDEDSEDEGVKKVKKSQRQQTVKPSDEPAGNVATLEEEGVEQSPTAKSKFFKRRRQKSAGATIAKRQRKTHKCYVCQKIFGGKTDLKRHELIHSNERPYKCSQCDKCYRQAVNLKNHITTAHERQKSFQCDQCPQRFALKERLRLHMRLHSGEKPYACTLCEKSFPRGGQVIKTKILHCIDG